MSALHPSESLPSAPVAAAAHYRVLDTYRFFAASGVVLYHFEAHYQPFRHESAEHLVRFQQFVDFFFVLSGFVIMHAYGARLTTPATYARFLWKRFARLYPLHLATVAICCALAMVVALGVYRVRDPSIVDMPLVPANLLLVQAWGVTGHPGLVSPSWSISAEVFAYLLFPVLALLLRRGGTLVALLCAVAFAVLVEAIRARGGYGPGYEATWDFGMVRAIAPFLAGMAVCVIVERARPRRIHWLYVHALGTVIVALMVAQAPAYLVIASFLPLVALIAMAERGGARTILARPAFVLLGNASYALYLLHTFLQIGSVSAIRWLGWTSPGGLAVVALVTFALAVAVSVISFVALETPARVWLVRHDPSRRPAAITVRAA